MDLHWLVFIVIGVLCGTFGAALGLGGGAVLVPILVVLFSFDQKVAQGTALGMMVPMALVSVWRYKQNPDITIDLGIVLWLSIGSVFGAFLGAAIAGALPVNTLRRIFALVLIVVAGRMLFTSAREVRSAAGADGENVPAAVEEGKGDAAERE